MNQERNWQIVAALRGHANWVRNYAASPKTYHRPECSAETFDHAADEIERLRAALKEISVGQDPIEMVGIAQTTLTVQQKGDGTP